MVLESHAFKRVARRCMQASTRHCAEEECRQRVCDVDKDGKNNSLHARDESNADLQ